MGWAGGSRLFSKLISVLKEEVPWEQSRARIYLKMIDAFCEDDWDTMNECLGEDDVYDTIYDERFPE